MHPEKQKLKHSLQNDRNEKIVTEIFIHIRAVEAWKQNQRGCCTSKILMYEGLYPINYYHQTYVSKEQQ